MKLKIFIPDFKEKIERKICVPPLHPFVTNNLSFEQRIERFGNWIALIEMVDTIDECDIVMPAFYVNYYYTNKKVKTLLEINQSANNASKLTICWTNGDWGITPSLKKFHLYRYSGYLSKNDGNQFCIPYFVMDPLYKYYGGQLPVHSFKPDKPVIGFCGRSSADLFSLCMDIAKNRRRDVLRIMGLWHEDTDNVYGTSFKRFKMLKELEKSDLVETNFIRYRKFGGNRSSGDKEKLKEIYYQNMKESVYVLCYRGWGNYSLRLYETMAAGKIPVLISSDNNLPFEEKIDWKIFPVIDQVHSKNIAESVALFHSQLSNHDFVDLQYKARNIWEEYLSYNGFMQHWIEQYAVINNIKSH